MRTPLGMLRRLVKRVESVRGVWMDDPHAQRRPDHWEAQSNDPGRWLWFDAYTDVHVGGGVGLAMNHFQFSLGPDVPADDALTELVRSQFYAHDFMHEYSSGGDVDPFDEERPVHASWYVDALEPHPFAASSADEAVLAVHAWLDDPDVAADIGQRTRRNVDDALARALPVRTSGALEVFMFVPPRDPAARTPLDVLDGQGYVEFAVLDRDREDLHLVVCCSD